MLATLKNILYPIVPAPLWKLMRPLWARYSFGTFKSRTIYHKYGPYKFQMHRVDCDGAEWYDHDWDSLPEMTLLRMHGLRPGAIAFNAGSNQGLQAMMLAKAVEPDGFVLGIEAKPQQCASRASERRTQPTHKLNIHRGGRVELTRARHDYPNNERARCCRCPAVWRTAGRRCVD